MTGFLSNIYLAVWSIVVNKRTSLRYIAITFLGFMLLPFSIQLHGAGANTGIFNHADTYFYPVNNNDQIPWGIVTSLMQDHQGFVWVGTQKGVMRFDGYQFQYHQSSPGQAGRLFYPWINTLNEVMPGQIWLGTREGLAIYHTKRGNFENYSALSDGDIDIELSSIDEIHTRGQAAWLVSGNKIIRINTRSMSAQLIGRPSLEKTPIDVNTIQFFGDDKLWVGTHSGLYIYDLKEATFSKVDTDLNVHINKLEFDAHDNLWVSTVSMGLRVIDKNKMSNHKNIRSELVSNGNFRSTVSVSNTEIWAMKNRDGIHVIDIESRSVLRHLKTEPLNDHSLQSMDIRTIMKDRSGIIWVGHWGGGILLHDMNNQYIKPLSVRSLGKMQSDHFHIDEIEVTKNFGVWLLGGKTVISLDPKNSFNIKHWPTINQFLNKIGNTTIYTSASKVLSNGTELLYFLTGNSVLFSFDPDSQEITEISTESILGCFESRGMVLDTTQRLWIACRQPAKLIRYDLDTHTVTPIASSQQKEIGLLNNVQLGPQQNIWLSSTSGLHTFSLKSAEPEKPIHIKHFVGHHIISVLFDKAGDLWVDGFSGLFKGTYTSGAWEFQSISEAIGVKKTQLFGNMLLNEKGWIWGDEGALDTQTLEFHPLRKGEGFNTGPNWIGSYNKLSDGTLLFGTDNQLIVMQSERYQPWKYSAPIVVSNVIIDNQTLAAAPDVIKLSAANKSFSVDIALLDYYNPNSSIYAYKLDGYDEEWIHTNAQNRRISYTNLSAGDYTLRIKGANTSQVWSKTEVALPIIKAASVYETILFKMAVTLLFLLAILGLHKLKVRHHKEKEQQLTLIVNERTNELQKSLDDLKTTQEKLVDTEKQALLGRLVRGLAHELNTPLGVIKMTESMLNEKLLDIFSVMSDCAAEATETYQPQMNKILTLLRENLERTITLVQHFKSVDVDDDSGEEMQWIELHSYLGLILCDTKVDASISGPQDTAILCDKNSLTIVVSELLKNALNHGGEKRLIRYRQVENDQGSQCEIIVEDHDQGIPPDIIDKIFDPFFSSKHAGGSPGLGLYIVENIVKFRLNGNIQANSEANKVTSFVLCFPAQHRTNQETEASRSISSHEI